MDGFGSTVIQGQMRAVSWVTVGRVFLGGRLLSRARRHFLKRAVFPKPSTTRDPESKFRHQITTPRPIPRTGNTGVSSARSYR